MKRNSLFSRSFFTQIQKIFQSKTSTLTAVENSEIILLDPYSLSLSKYWKDDWLCTSDRGYGGPSISELSIEGIETKDENMKFLRFQGSLDMTQQVAKSLGVTGGFCAFRGEVNCFKPLDNYEGFEIICKSGIDTNVILNTTLENRTEEDVFQSRLCFSRSNTWRKYHIPFSTFRLTLFGRDRQGQGSFEGSSVESFGMLIRNHKGPFRIDILSIKILPKLDSKFSVESEYKRPTFFRIGSVSTISKVPGKIYNPDLLPDQEEDREEEESHPPESDRKS